MKPNDLRLLSRREFMKTTLGLVAIGATVPSFLGRTVLAFPATGTSGKDDPILVIIQLSGGNDGLNTVIPYNQDPYYRLRPTLHLPKDQILKINDEIGLHPALVGFKSLYDKGHLSIVQGVGYPNPDRSHFRSTEIWESAISEGFESSGWIGRLFDHTCNNAHLKKDKEISPTLSVSVGETLSPALRGQSGIGVALKDPERFWGMTRLYRRDQVKNPVPSAPTTASPLDFLNRTALNAELSADRIRQSVRNIQSKTDYPKNTFAQGLKLIASMIAGGMDTRVYYISLGGFDTHANQKGNHERLLSTLSGGIAAFQKDLQTLGHADRVMGFTFSEFGRRVAENGSGGTDHGQAAPMFVFGNKVKAGVYGGHPSLEKLKLGDLTYQTDFRQIYSAVLEGWMKVDSKEILGAEYKALPIFG